MKMAECSLNGQKTMGGKGEIACYKQFLLLPHCFKRLVLQSRKKPGIVWERVKGTLYTPLQFENVCVILVHVF